MVVLPEILAGQQQLDGVEVEQEVRPRHPPLEIVHVVAGDRVFAEPVAVLGLGRHTEQHVLRDRPAHGGLGEDLVVVAVGQTRIAREHVRRLGGDQVDRAAGRVAAVERALRPAQHLDALEVEQ